MMSEPKKAPIPVNIVTGFLGVGKTTALMHLLAHKPANEYWAIVVNEFGEVGIDGASLSAAGEGLQVAEVPGGCICCTTSPQLRVTLTKLARGIRPDRLLIEPSGLGHPAGIVDLLRDPMLASAFELRAIITLLDPRHLGDSRYTTHETWRDQLQLADVLVLNKCDLADEEQIAAAEKMAAAQFPPKLAVQRAHQGVFAAQLLDLELHPERWPEAQTTGQAQSHRLMPRKKAVDPDFASTPEVWPVKKMHSSLGSHSCGWIFSPETLFSSAKVAALFEQIGSPDALALHGLSRAKGVFQTERDWYRFDWVEGMVGAAPSAYRRDSRFEVIVESETAPDWTLLEAQLLATLMTPV
ncbi:GTP-binding protein [Chitinibacter bivalviorum]|uniref:GTP-binding protein n=1 Tax=Chitinibacter bivalviorum TaxID=2739434 RepID=A0A7H9BJQ5_9NEIS|nr:CobW family GTP-binding protein [Chitinibacter bivalviorum]QLG88900.1 GTP-binding protein [Chitinibacter bivalviorum]